MIFISPKMIFISEYVNRRTTSINHIFYFVHFWKTLFTKIGHNFWELPGKFVWRISKNYLTRIHQWPKIYLRFDAGYPTPKVNSVYLPCHRIGMENSSLNLDATDQCVLKSWIFVETTCHRQYTQKPAFDEQPQSVVSVQWPIHR